MTRPLSAPSNRRQWALWFSVGTLTVLIVGLFIASFFLDEFIRSRTEGAMNQKLRGYHVTLPHAHLQLVGGRLTLSNLTIVQQAHPHPPIMAISTMRFDIEWKELLFGRVVADVLLWRPWVHIDRTQFVAEKNDRRPLKQKGWQAALESAYPFKINRLTVADGDLLYIQDATSPPLHLARLNFVTDNIRNIHAPGSVYPSTLRANMVMFGTGETTIEGHANYLEEPFPGARLRFAIKDAPLSAFDPEIRTVNSVRGGRLSSNGVIEYSPRVTRVEVDRASIEGVSVNYIHTGATKQVEAQRVQATGKQIERQNNRPAVDIKVREFAIGQSDFSFTDQAADPNYRLFVNNTDLVLNNLSNHQQEGPAALTMHGRFMGSGETAISGNFFARQDGPAFNVNIAIQNTNLTSLNSLLRAYGRFDVAAGQLSVFSTAHISNGNISGYIKPLFTNIEVYNYRKDQRTSVLHQAKELMIGGASDLFKNSSTGRVATQVDLRGKLTRPDVSTWQAIVEVLHNAFVSAILPGIVLSSRMAARMTDNLGRCLLPA